MVNVGYIGSIYPGRGVEVICELAKKNPKIIFNIIGGSNELSKKYKKKYNFKNLNFLGFIPYSNITDYFSNQNILIAPYQEKIGISGGVGINTASYMSPLKLFEYMASRRAIIVSKLPVLEEVVNSDCVMFCDPTEINSWNSALNKLINNDKLYNNLIDNSYKLFINNYTVEKRVENINSFINYNLK